MDVSQLHGNADSSPLDEEEYWDYDYELNALGKGKGLKGSKGKGKGQGKANIQCYSCGQFGHVAAWCPKGNAKGKGKPMNNPTCWQCGSQGHTQRDCPHLINPGNVKGARPPMVNFNSGWPTVHSAVKGKGKTLGKTVGKGAYEIRQEEPYEEFDEPVNCEPVSHGFGGGSIDVIDQAEQPWI